MSGELTAADFAEGEWATGVVGGKRVPLYRSRGENWYGPTQWVDGGDVTDLRRAVFVETPGRPYFVDEDAHGDLCIWEDRGHRDPLMVLNLGPLPAALAYWLRDVLPGKPKPDPATVWTDHDVVQDTDNLGVAWREDGAWYSRAGRYAEDAEMAAHVRHATVRILRQASTGVGCEDPS